MTFMHWILIAIVLGLGIYLFGHPALESRHSKLVRGIIIWIGMVLILRVLDYLFLS